MTNPVVLITVVPDSDADDAYSPEFTQRARELFVRCEQAPRMYEVLKSIAEADSSTTTAEALIARARQMVSWLERLV